MSLTVILSGNTLGAISEHIASVERELSKKDMKTFVTRLKALEQIKADLKGKGVRQKGECLS
jgi:hypothetical protein